METPNQGAVATQTGETGGSPVYCCFVPFPDPGSSNNACVTPPPSQQMLRWTSGPPGARAPSPAGRAGRAAAACAPPPPSQPSVPDPCARTDPATTRPCVPVSACSSAHCCQGVRQEGVMENKMWKMPGRHFITFKCTRWRRPIIPLLKKDGKKGEVGNLL